MSKSNRLIHEKSPYLLQHAHNPVDWYPWGNEAFERAAAEDKPIFLSIGYSTCHWCHVMERESFEDEETAALLNRSFVPIKVDREERPDVDRIYMTFVQATSGSGGWPMSVFLTPDRKPFFGGTYFPPDNRYGRPGFRSILTHLAQAWISERPKIIESGDQVAGMLRQYAGETHAGALPGKEVLDSCFFVFRRTFDARNGGFGDAPKFPRPVVLNFLLRYYHQAHNDEALDMVVKTLHAMADGGMHDQLGGGFHRYSVDERWFVPHFEKMLYDQAQLAISYLEAYQITKEERFAEIAKGIFDYVQRDMTSPEGAFYSAEDADSVIDPANPSEKGEGAFYLWKRAEIDELLGAVADSVSAHYGVEADGNVHNDPHQEFTGKNILYIARPLDQSGQPVIGNARQRLLEARSKRIRPHLDDKILTAWNGLMISAFAKGAQVLDEKYTGPARRAMDFLLGKLYDPATGTLLRRFRDGDAGVPGFLDDYAFLTQALLDLYEAVFDLRYLETAARLAEEMIRRFEDSGNGGFFSTAEGDASLLVRMKDDYDGAEPSANSIAILVLQRLGEMTNRPEFRDASDRALRALGRKMTAQPSAAPQLLVALGNALFPHRQIVLSGDREAVDMRALVREIHARFLPGSISLMLDSETAQSLLARSNPPIAGMKPVDGQPAAYVCQNYACQLPVTEASKLAELLQ